VSVLFASSLFGVLGALLAIPAAASISVVVREYRAYRRAQAEHLKSVVSSTPIPPPPAAPPLAEPA
jgi:predicted PurR-regulated permease PerM